MKSIENYLEGNLTHSAKMNFERKMKNDKSFRKLVFLYKNVNLVMQGAFLAAEAEIEMMRKKIDVVAAGMVSEFYTEKGNFGNYREFLSWS